MLQRPMSCDLAHLILASLNIESRDMESVKSFQCLGGNIVDGRRSGRDSIANRIVCVKTVINCVSCLQRVRQDQRPWSTMQCNKPAAWTSNRSLVVLLVSCVKTYPGRLINSGSILARVTHLDGRVIGYHQCHHLSLGKCSGISRHAANTSWLFPACFPTTTSIPAPTQHTITMTNYIHATTVINPYAFHAQLWRF